MSENNQNIVTTNTVSFSAFVIYNSEYSVPVLSIAFII